MAWHLIIILDLRSTNYKGTILARLKLDFINKVGVEIE